MSVNLPDAARLCLERINSSYNSIPLYEICSAKTNEEFPKTRRSECEFVKHQESYQVDKTLLSRVIILPRQIAATLLSHVIIHPRKVDATLLSRESRNVHRERI